MSKKQPTKISELTPDDKNFNLGTQFGNSLIEKSFRKFGAGRSILIDKNNNIIAGNKTIENAAAIGMEEVQIVESDGKRIIAVKRTDIDLDSPEGREMALADNATAKQNIEWDEINLCDNFDFEELQEWGINLDGEPDEKNSGLKNGELYIKCSFKELSEIRQAVKEIKEVLKSYPSSNLSISGGEL